MCGIQSGSGQSTSKVKQGWQILRGSNGRWPKGAIANGIHSGFVVKTKSSTGHMIACVATVIGCRCGLAGRRCRRKRCCPSVHHQHPHAACHCTDTHRRQLSVCAPHDGHAIVAPRQPPLAQPRHALWVQPVLLFEHARRQLLRPVRGVDRDHRLGQDGACSTAACGEKLAGGRAVVGASSWA